MAPTRHAVYCHDDPQEIEIRAAFKTPIDQECDGIYQREEYMELKKSRMGTTFFLREETFRFLKLEFHE